MTTEPKSQGPYCPEDGEPMVKAAEYGSLTYYRCLLCPGWTYDGDQGSYHSGVPEGATELQELVDALPVRELVVRELYLRVNARKYVAETEALDLVRAVNLAIAHLDGSPLLDCMSGDAYRDAEYRIPQKDDDEP